MTTKFTCNASLVKANESCQEIAKLMADKGFFRVSCRIRTPSLIGENDFDISLDYHFGPEWRDGTHTELVYGSFNALEGKIDALLDHIKRTPGPAEKRRQEFMANMLSLVQRGREIGIEDAIVNPLAEIAKKLSENVIEHKKLDDPEAWAAPAPSYREGDS